MISQALRPLAVGPDLALWLAMTLRTTQPVRLLSYPTPLTDTLTLASSELDGVARARDLLALGYAPGQLANLCRAGLLEPVLADLDGPDESLRGLPLIRPYEGACWAPVAGFRVAAEVVS